VELVPKDVAILGLRNHHATRIQKSCKVSYGKFALSSEKFTTI
jgi:hypothetical protein